MTRPADSCYNSSMDVYLTEEAVRFLKIMVVLSGPSLRGFLIGHARGPRIYVESVIPAAKDGDLSYDRIAALDRETGGRTVGFFLAGTSPAAKNRLLRPFATGKVCLEIKGRRRGSRDLKAFLIDYDEAFRFSPVQVTSASARNQGHHEI